MPEHTLPDPLAFSEHGRLRGLDSTRRLAREVAERLTGGEVLLLHGPLGAGKTYFVQKLCEALAVQEQVVSPTFTLANRYLGRVVVHHLDFYRVDENADLDDIGTDAILDEVTAGGAVLVAEWPERLVPLAPERLEWLILPTEISDEREWHLRGVPALPEGWRGMLAAIAGDSPDQPRPEPAC